MSVKVSVIIPGKNSRSYLEEVIEALVEQDVDFPYEIIYVDDSSTDGSVELVKELSKKYGEKIRLIQVSDTFPGEARNIGAKFARGEYLAFLDADCVPPKDWLSKLVNRYEKLKRSENLGALGATLIAEEKSSFFNKAFYMVMQTKVVSGGSPQFYRYKEITEVKNLPGGNFLISKNHFLSIGGFRTDIKYCEDVEFHLRLRRSGLKIFYSPGSEVRHKKEFNSFLSVAKFMFNYGCGRTCSGMKVKKLLTPVHKLIIYLQLLLAFLLTVFVVQRVMIYLNTTTMFPIYLPIQLPTNFLFYISEILLLLFALGILSHIILLFANSVVLALKNRNPKYLITFPIGLVAIYSYFIGLSYCYIFRGKCKSIIK